MKSYLDFISAAYNRVIERLNKCTRVRGSLDWRTEWAKDGISITQSPTIDWHMQRMTVAG